MSENLDPIEIQFLINSPEVLEDAARVEQSLQGVDKAVAKTEEAFNAYVKQQLEANKAMQDGVKLSQEQQQSFDRYANTISGLQGFLNDATDPTQIAVYNKEIEQTTEKLKALVDSNRSKISIVNTEELERAGQLLDSISDKTFTPSFASNAELENLSVEINKAKDEFGQLGAVIDFVEAKMSGMDKGSDTYKNLSKDIEVANEMLGRTIVAYDTTNNSIDQLNDALMIQKDLLAGETDVSKITTLNQNIEELETKITQLKNVGKSGFDEFGNKIVEQTENTKGLKGQLADLVQQMAQLKMAGKTNTEAYRELSAQATSLRSAISTVNQEITQTASATNHLDTLIRATKGIASGYAVAKSASSLFGTDQKNVEQAILKVTSAMSLLQGLQVIQAELLRKESMATKGLILLKRLYAKAVGESTGAMKTFKVALLATGIGVFIVLLGELVANWDKVKRSIGLTSDALERSQAISKKANDLFGDQIAKLRMLAATNKEVVLTDQQKKEAVKEFNKEFADTLGTVKDYAELESRIIKNAPAYIEYLQMKAQAEASYILSLEKQKNLLEQITALSTGDLKWYDQLQDFSDKMFEKGWKAVGANIGETNRDITQSEILNIIGLPSENQFNEALKGYSSVIQSNLKEFRKQQQKDEGLFTTSFDLQKKAGELASKLNIKTPDKEEDKAAKKAFQERIKALAEIAKAENAYQKQRLTGVEKELLDVEQRYKALREQAIKAKLDAKAIGRIDKLEVDEKKSVTYKNDTTELLKQLDKEKELYKAFEELKTQIGSTELLKRYENEFKGFADFQSRLKSEIDKIESGSVGSVIAFPEEEARLKLLKEMLAKQDIEVNKNSDKKYLEAYQAILTFEEKKAIIENQYLQDKIQIEKITDENLRKNKLAELEYLKNLGINQIKDETYQRRKTFENLSENLIGITKKELSVRIASLEEYYKLSESILTNEQKVFVENEIAKAKAVIAYTDAGIREKSALQAKARIEKDLLKSRELSNEAVDELLRLLEKANSELFFMAEDSTVGILDNISLVGDSVAGLGSDLKGVNSELGEAVEQAAELASAFANILSKIASGDYIGAIVSAIATVGKMISEIGRRSEKEKQRQARQAKQAYANQLEYNAQLREQLLIETSINDLYQSRTEQIEEQLNAMKQNATSVARDMQNAFDKIFNAIKRSDKIEDTILPNGMKLNRMAYIGEILGFDMKDLKEVPQLTDEIYEKLQLLNNVDPFEGGVKETFEQLKRLKEEYGSINDAMKALAIEWKDTVTGTTASTLANSIREGVASGKKTFADFADDIEGFLRDAIVAGMSARIIEPQVQELQDALYDMMGDGALSGDEMKQFQEMYMKIVSEAKEAMDMINQAGIDIGGSDKSNTLKGAIKGITAEQADLLSGQFGGMRMAQLETNHLLRSGAASQLQSSSRMIELQTQIEINTRLTATNTLATVKELKKLNNHGANQNNGLLLQRASGAWIP